MPANWRRLLIGISLGLLAVMAVQQLQLTLPYPVTRTLMQTQDIPVLLGVVALLLGMAFVRMPEILTQLAERAVVAAPAVSKGLIAFAAIVVALGSAVIVRGHTWTFDEYMAWFDAEVIASGRLIAPVAPEWRPFVPSLLPYFRLPVPGNEAWISSYLPGNAALRATLGLALHPVLVNVALAVAALIALVGVARRLWPDRPEAWLIALVLGATSAQLLCMAMTPWAMSAHLALNMIWLWLFLRNSGPSHAAAVAVGFLATGLHQIVFHPLFVAPFLLQLLLDRRWKLGAFYAASYAAIGIFWILYWQFLLAGIGSKPEQASAMGLPFLLSRIAAMLANFNASAFETMVQNLLRFAAWQTPLMLILLVPGLMAAWRAGGVFRSLAGGVWLTLLAMLVLLPYQDAGWGYRYVHGLIGSAALIGALGWIELTARATPSDMRAARGIALASTAVAVLILLPVHALQMRGMINPYATAVAAISATKSEAVVIDTIGIYYGDDLIRNDPYLRNRPLTFDIGHLDDALIRMLCSRMRVTVFDRSDAARFGIVQTDPTTHPDYPRLKRLRDFAASDECRKLKPSG